ncbi:PREDICTED: uncharacterized protein C14orf93 homolog [Cyprinodon variegatus]|uniref:uncharacterized protein C14orf93 homolog n=1 Tax=Cyprinodon variegatus TaxID=28743 RepID=UPI00074254A6|nr:PREDICTED: uncharacterized protein C14orf93 homolog [Cyprinodon variegatus]
MTTESSISKMEFGRKNTRTRSDNARSLLLSSHDPTGRSYVQPGVGEIDEGEMQSEDPEKEVMEEMHPATDCSDNAACKTYYETVRRSFRHTQPENTLRTEAAKHSARSQLKRKRLLESRQSVLADEEVELWKSATVDLMSDEEDGVVGGVSGWIVRSPPFCRPDLSEPCVKLQSRLEAMAKYRATHSRRLHIGPASVGMLPVTSNPEEKNGQFTEL